MILGINWSKDNIVGKFKDIFTENSTRSSFAKNLQGLLGEQGYIRYPGGEYVQWFPLSYSEAEKDYTFPGYPIFYKFCKENNLNILQQLPTFAVSDGGSRRTIKDTVKGRVKWNLVEQIITKAKEMIDWILDNGYEKNVTFWQIGNEPWIDSEGKLTPQEYVEIVARYIKVVGPLISSEKLMIVVQSGKRGDAINWGAEVLKLFNDRGLSNFIGGVSTHVYPYYFNREILDKSGLNFEAYCLSDMVISSVDAELNEISELLDTLGYSEKVKIHVTEMSIEIAGPVRNSDDWQSFRNNRKNYAAGVGAVRCLLTAANRKRFGGGAYFSLTHKYLVAPEELNPTKWKGYTKADDWGWGQCWFLPKNSKHIFLNAPTLECWAMMTRFVSGANQIEKLAVLPPVQAYLSVINDESPVRLLLLNHSDKQINVNLNGTSGLLLGNGILNHRVIRIDSFGDEKDISPLVPERIALSGAVILPAYSLLYAEGRDIVFNNIRMVPELIKTKAFLKGKQLPIGNFSVKYYNGRLIPHPYGAKIFNFPIALIENTEGLSTDVVSRNVFGMSCKELKEWSIGYEDEI